jgi:hypothetical protein
MYTPSERPWEQPIAANWSRIEGKNLCPVLYCIGLVVPLRVFYAPIMEFLQEQTKQMMILTANNKFFNNTVREYEAGDPSTPFMTSEI